MSRLRHDRRFSRGLHPLQCLPQPPERLVVKLRHARGRDRQHLRNLAQRNLLQIVQHDDRGLGLRQLLQAPEQFEPALCDEQVGVRARHGQIGQPLGEGKAFLAALVVEGFIERESKRRGSASVWKALSSDISISSAAANSWGVGSRSNCSVRSVTIPWGQVGTQQKGTT